MKRDYSQMPKKYRDIYSSVLETLKENSCVSAYSIEGHEVSVDWTSDGFQKSFTELKESTQPFEMKKKYHRATLMLILINEKRSVLMDWIDDGMKARFGIE